MTTKNKTAIFVLLLTSGISACAPLQPPNATGPRGSEAVYPVVLTADSRRTETATVAVNRLSPSAVSPSTLQLQPITATVASLPANVPFYLPKVGASAAMTEEETRESLRRFIRDWQDLIGSEPSKLSLIERTDQPDGSKLAVYEQRPFRYPIRGNYGKLQIHFSADRRILDLTSTCIPDAERIQPTLNAVNTKLTADDAVKQLQTNGVSYLDANGNKVNFKTFAGEIKPRELVIYVTPAAGRTDVLEFHVAWEIELTNAPAQKVYVDAVTGDVVGAR